jgi:DNA-binding transcriptional ArsR family regulator
MRTNALAEVGALVGDPGRANMLVALVDGRALTATELAARAGVTPQTASGHLARLLAAGLIAMERQGRHRYHRLAGPDVARMLEAMMLVAAAGPPSGALRTGPADKALRTARTCYDHFAGRLGVGLADALVARGCVSLADDGGEVSAAGRSVLEAFGVDLPALAARRRAFCRPCLDWSERRPHLAGAVGAGIMSRCFELGWTRRDSRSRAVTITPDGQLGFRRVFGLNPL